jgi:hypothetical protein
MSKNGRPCLLFLAASVAAAPAFPEVVHLNNGDAIHGTLVAANNNQVTLKTPYGELVIPKKDIARIDYDDSGAPAASGGPGAAPKEAAPADVPKKSAGRAAITLQIRGRSFWYAFDSPPGLSADPSLRLRVYIENDRACTFVDEKPDTVDGVTLYNSFTFSPTDSRLLESLEGFDCKVEKAPDGAVVLRLLLPPNATAGVESVRLLYEVNEGTRESPRFVDAVARAFSLQVEPGKEALAVLEQNADALEYTGFFKKKMKNVELFKMSLVSTELKD